MNIIKENTKLSEHKLPYEVQELEQEPIITTNQNHEYDDYEPESFDFVTDYLYHGIRFQKYLEKLENIFKERLNSLETDLSQKRNKLDELKNTTIQVKLIDLITELSHLTGVDIKDMSINIECDFIRWGKNRNIKEFLKFIEAKKHEGTYINLNLKILIVGSKKYPTYKNHPHPFYYFFETPFNMNEIQLDGKTLLDHCSVKKLYDDMQGEYYTKIVVDKKGDKIILNIKLGDIFRKEDYLCYTSVFDTCFYPCNIFNEAIRNCIERNYQPENETSYQKKIKL